MTPDQALAARAEQTHGVFRIEHAAQLGLTRPQIDRRIAAGRWVEARYGVYRIAGVPPTWKGELLAACWAGGTRAVAARRSAAAVHALPGGVRDLIEIMCPRWRRARHAGLFVHETKALPSIDVTVVDGIPVTSVARTLFDLGGCYGTGMVEYALESALRRGLVTLPELDATLRRLSRRGRPGGPVLRRLVAARTAGQRATDSDTETRLRQVIRAAGLPEPVPQFEVWSGSRFLGRVDFAYPDARIAIEYDSDEHHSGRVATRRDRARRHDLVAAGWLPIDIGPGELRRGATGATAAIASALHARSGVKSRG
jgi:very-short-patch-repair endonuclease